MRQHGIVEKETGDQNSWVQDLALPPTVVLARQHDVLYFRHLYIGDNIVDSSCKVAQMRISVKMYIVKCKKLYKCSMNSLVISRKKLFISIKLKSMNNLQAR